MPTTIARPSKTSQPRNSSTILFSRTTSATRSERMCTLIDARLYQIAHRRVAEKLAQCHRGTRTSPVSLRPLQCQPPIILRSGPAPCPAVAHTGRNLPCTAGANILPGMSTRPRSQAGPPMTLGNVHATDGPSHKVTIRRRTGILALGNMITWMRNASRCRFGGDKDRGHCPR